MDWLRCNKCYRAIKNSNKTFSLTQCGHFYCSRCMADVTAKCAVCGRQDFKTVTLSNPPNFETTYNFFAPLDEFIYAGIRIEKFHNNQVCIAVRIAAELEKKYDTLKTIYWNGMKNMHNLMQSYQKLQAETSKLEAIRNSMLKARKVRNDNTVSNDSRFLCYAQGNQKQRIQGNLPRQHAEQQNTQKYPATNSFLAKSKPQTPEQAYSPSTDCSSSIPGSSPGRMGVFRVPSAQKVPKSAATLKKKEVSFRSHHRTENGR